MLSLPKNVISYIKGLCCVFENANCVSLAYIVKCSHDNLTRVLKGEKLSWQTLLESFILRTFGRLQDGWLIIDDTVIAKQFAKKIENLAWIFDSKIGKSILGLNLILIAWSNGKITIPFAFKVYQKKNGKSKVDLACELIHYAKKLRIKPKYVVFDSWYGASQIFQEIKKCHWKFVTRLKGNRILNGVPLKEIARNPYWIIEGKLNGGFKVIVVRHGAKYFASSDLALSKEEILTAYKSRWAIETIFKALHSKLGLDECQARKLEAQTAHFHLCMMAYLVLEKESFIQKTTFYQVKRNCSFNFNYADNLLNTLFFQGA